MRQLKQIANYETPPEIIQVERNPLRTCEDEVNFCLTHNMIFQAYSPLCKMHPKLRDSVLLKNLAEKYNKSIGQIILRWHLQTDVTPVFTSKKSSRIKEYSRIFDFDLNDDDITKILSLNINHKMYLESVACPGF